MQPYGGHPPYVKGSDTSKAAADSVDSSAAAMRLKIDAMALHRGPVGITCDEVEVSLSMLHQTASARIRELVQQGWLVDSGLRRMTRRNRKATVYWWTRPAP
jgi:hypothetical protein